MRLRNKPWAKDFLKEKNYVYYVQDKKNILDEHKFDHICIEIGCGKGNFICEMAKKYPDKLFIGIEKYESVAVIAAKKIEEENVSNAILLIGDAENLRDVFDKNSISEIYLNFSDPWPKKRHARRRLTHYNFLLLYLDLLMDNGFIQQKTDNKSLFEFSLLQFQHPSIALEEVSVDLHRNKDIDNVMTEYEKKFVALNQPIHLAKWRKK